MKLEKGQRLGKFEVLELVGRGGMGEVYRARDTELKREVAIKVLPDALAQDPERVARFEREARMLASMAHPHIAFIHDLGRKENLLFLVLEFVPGPTLEELLEERRIEVREALEIFRQVASALEAAHAKGILHRDLKPANVKIAPDGVKVLDFGLAKEVLEETADGTGSKTKTAPVRMSRRGDVIGTPAYMSPEQARGLPLDKRTDIWSFGCCLYEALTGRHPFEGKTTSDVLVAVLQREPDMNALPSELPASVEKLLRRCLRKEKHQRLHDLGDARLELEETLSDPPRGESARRRRLPLAWVGGVGAALVTGWIAGSVTTPEEDRLAPVRRFEVELPPMEALALDGGPSLAISSDGSRIVYAAWRGDATELWMRTLDRLEPSRLPGTAGARMPFFSPGGDEIGFFQEGRMERLAFGAMAPAALGASPSPRGASWSERGILFSPQTVSGLHSLVPDRPGATVVTKLASDMGERSHRWPEALGDGRRALFTSWTGDRFDIDLVSLETGERRLLVENGSFPKYASTGHLLFVRGDDIMAVRFDPDEGRLGEPVPVVEGVHVDELTGAASFDVSEEGTLVYAPSVLSSSHEGTGTLLRVDRNGEGSLLQPQPRGYQVPRLSASDRQVLVTITESERTHVWLADVVRGTLRPLTFQATNAAAIWSPDEERIVFSSDREGPFNLFLQSLESSEGARRLTTSPNAQFPNAWSPDGRYLVYSELDSETQLDLWSWDAEGERTQPLVNGPFNESAAVFSPDGRFVAYVSDETGRDEIYVRPFPGPGAKELVSTNGGSEPVWSKRGSELFYRAGEWMMVVPVQTAAGFSAGAPRLLFEAPFDEAGTPYANYDVSADGESFIMVRSVGGRSASRLVVVLDWFTELETLVP